MTRILINAVTNISIDLNIDFAQMTTKWVDILVSDTPGVFFSAKSLWKSLWYVVVYAAYNMHEMAVLVRF